MAEPATGKSRKADVERIRAAATPVAAADERVVGLYLFGSRASGDAHPRSDIDLAVLPDEPLALDQLVALEGRFEDALRAAGKAAGEGPPPAWQVDLIDVGRASPFLALDAIRGERLYAADADRCDEFDLYVLRRAGDLAPFERQRQRLLFAWARNLGKASG